MASPAGVAAVAVLGGGAVAPVPGDGELGAAGLTGPGTAVVPGVVLLEGDLPEPPHSSCDPSSQMEAMQSRIQMPAVTIVTRVNMSPALVPNALWPPMPPKAPVKPPPRPRWTRTNRIRNKATTNIRIPSR